MLALPRLSGRRRVAFGAGARLAGLAEQESMSKVPMTAAGHLALETELKHRIQVERPRLVQRIQEAIADDSNLAENSEYHAAKAEQELNEARIAELEDKLARAEIIDVSKLSGDTVKFGATVTLIEEDSGEKKVWQIVGEPEADVNKGKDLGDFTDRARVDRQDQRRHGGGGGSRRRQVLRSPRRAVARGQAKETGQVMRARGRKVPTPPLR
jgi:transcription elongation factor GreA